MTILIRIVVGFLLIITGLFASDSAEYVEYILVDAGWSSWFLSPYISRILTGSSMVLGMLILLGMGARKVIYRSAMLLSAGMLLLAVIQPTLLGLTRCYACLSELNKISRYQGIFIWSFALLLSFFLYRKGVSAKGWQLPAWSAWVVVVLLFPIPFILNYPAHWAIYGEQAEVVMHRDLQLARLDTVRMNPALGTIPPGLKQGRKLLCLASLTCPFCSRMAYKLHIIRKDHPDFPVLVLLSGEESGLPSFLKRSKMENVPYYLMNNNLMHEFTEGRVPRIFLLENGIAVKEINYWALSPASIESDD